METKEIKSFYELLSAEVSDFWKTHYTFSAESSQRTKRLGKASIEGLLINTIIPFLFIYGKMKLRDDLCDLSLSLLEKIPAEKNSTTREWSKHLGSVDNAAKSQALTELTKNYCTEKKCLYCQIGNSIIQQHT
ncbi:MAG TPA: hypothetical protein DDX98_05170 [Bacteroidales bacterium]|nr:hypothetical protein [Bacteroidales bacterium]